MVLNEIDELMENTLDRLRGAMDISSVIGEPIRSGNKMIVPVTKVGFGFVTGGGEYSETMPKTANNLPYAGGSGGGVSIKPLGFLVVGEDDTDYVSIDGEAGESAWKDLLKASINILKK